ncbi:MAG TPA: Ig-like domain-containing protein [Anaerolineae bacterium]|nr:Ig-like domain-containing protein [Anaerolineae bacterium]
MKRNLWLLLGLFMVILACTIPEPPPLPATATPLVPQPTATLPPPPTSLPTWTPTALPTPTPLPPSVRLDTNVNLADHLSRAPLLLHFSQPMDTASAADPLAFVPPVEGKFLWDDTATLLIFIPADGFTPGKQYEFSVNRALKAADGQPLQAEVHRWTLTIAPAPEVKTYNLYDGATPFHDYTRPTTRHPTARITFSRPMQRLSVERAVQIEPSTRYALTWEENTLAIDFTQPLSPATAYTVTLAASAVDVDDTPLIHKYLWALRTRPVVSVLTGPDLQNRARPIMVYFDYPLNPVSVEKILFFNPTISGTMTWNPTGDILTFTPTLTLPSHTDFTLNFAGAFLDANGDSLEPPPPLKFTSPPPIVGVIPKPMSATHPATPVQIIFDRPMDESATAAALSFDPPITGTVVWNEATLTFTPDQGYLDEYTVYTVTIGTGARGAQGEAVLSKPYSWTFTTDQMTRVATFGYGPNAQVVDADGRRAVQFVLATGGQPTVTVALYRLTLEQFLDRYASGFRGAAGWEFNRPISTEGATPVKQWAPELRLGVGGKPAKLGRPAEAGYNLTQELVIPADVPPGLYLLNLESGYVNDQLILVLTRHTLTLKQAEGQIVAWVTDIAATTEVTGVQAGGAPVAGAEVGVYTRGGAAVAQGVSDANGVFRAAVARDPAPYLVIARQGDDITAAGLTDEWRTSGTRWQAWWQPMPTAQDYAAYIYTDRPIYKPGQTVFFKAVVRRDADAVLSLPPEDAPVTLRIRDARNNVVQTFTDLTPNAFGTLSGTFTLADGAMLGQYAIEMAAGGESHRQIFKVEDYRKPDYAVTFAPFPQRIILGESLNFTTTSAYYFGEPAAGADIEVRLFQLEERSWWDTGSEGKYTWYQTSSSPLAQGKTRNDGVYTFRWKPQDSAYWRLVNWRSSLQRSVWGIEATVNDGSNQTVSSFATVEVYNARESITLDAGGYLHKPNEAFPLKVQVTDIDGAPVAKREVALTLRRWDGGDYRQVVQSAQLTTDDAGRASLDFTIAEPGSYQLRAEGKDALGNAIAYRTYVFSYSTLSRRWYGRSSQLQIDADRETYAPGDTAKVVIESAFSGPALLTFERGTTRREQVIELTAPATLVDVPIQADDAPNVFVTVNAWQGQRALTDAELYYRYQSLPDAQLYVATVELQVPVTDKTLTVTLTPDKPTYGPREAATFAVRVTDALSRPVQAEVSLALVDEAIFALSEELSGPLHAAFYAPRQHIVRTYDALALLRILMLNGRGGGGDGESFAGNPRSDFPDTAAWFPALRTDADGWLTVTLTLPDSLTSWRLTAKAVTTDTQVGEAKVNIITRQDVVVRPILPRILTAGDEVLLSALVHNYADVTQTLTVTLTLSPSPSLPLSPSQVTLAPGNKQLIGWTVTLTQTGAMDVLVEAVTDGDYVVDAVRLPLLIQPLAVPDVTTEVGQFQGALTATIVMPAGALTLSGVRLDLSRSIAGTLLEGVEYLTGFPYGCVEQTMSRALPNAVVGRALKQLGVSNLQLEADLPPKVAAGLQRLYGYQHNDGGWGWWYDDSTHDYQTAWVVFGLATTAEAGYDVDAGVITRGVEWLNQNLGGMDIRTRAYALYSMAVAGAPNITETLKLTEQLDALDTFSRAGLALALHAAGEAEAADKVMDVLIETAVTADGKTSWTGDDYDGHYYDKTMASPTRSTALALSALVEIRPDSPLIPNVVRWLMAQRKQDGWGSTNETAYSLLALTDHLLATSFSEAATATTYTVTLGDTVIAEGKLGRGEPAVSLEIPAAQLQPGENTLRITHDGTKPLYYVINTRVYLAQAAIEPEGDVQVSRDYLDPETHKPVEMVKPGKLVEVRVQVKLGDDASYVIVEDHLPGGLEPLNEGLNTTSRIGAVHEEPVYYWQKYGYNQKEVWGDRVSFFITELPAGTRTFTYYARATHAGTFVALPVEVSAMYDLSVWGRSGSQVMVVSKE